MEGTGKTTVAARLARELDADQAPEFSAAVFGRALCSVVATTPHHISTSPVGQSLVFLGDFFEVHATAVAPRLRQGRTVVSDRGYLSKYTYQEVVLAAEIGADAARALLGPVFACLPPPDLTVRLVAPTPCLRERLLRRDGHCDPAREGFIDRAVRAADEFLRRTPGMAVATIAADRSVDEVVADAVAAVRAIRHS